MAAEQALDLYYVPIDVLPHFRGGARAVFSVGGLVLSWSNGERHTSNGLTPRDPGEYDARGVVAGTGSGAWVLDVADLLVFMEGQGTRRLKPRQPVELHIRLFIDNEIMRSEQSPALPYRKNEWLIERVWGVQHRSTQIRQRGRSVTIEDPGVDLTEVAGTDDATEYRGCIMRCRRLGPGRPS